MQMKSSYKGTNVFLTTRKNPRYDLSNPIKVATIIEDIKEISKVMIEHEPTETETTTKYIQKDRKTKCFFFASIL